MSIRSSIKGLFIKYFPNIEAGRILFFLPKIREYDFSTSKPFSKREEIYDFLNTQFVSNQSLSYLEFGVYKGDSIKYWAKINKKIDSEFIGFDTFTGLPENWQNITGAMRKNHFDTNGIAPEFGDSRCHFIKGMFQDTLEPFLKNFSSKEILLIHNDSDLYSSTLFTLAKMHPFLSKGTIIIFDEFSSPLHEMRALNDFSTSHLLKFKIICHTKTYDQVAIQIC